MSNINREVFKVIVEKKMSDSEEGSSNEYCNDRGICGISEKKYCISKQSSCNHNPQIATAMIQCEKRISLKMWLEKTSVKQFWKSAGIANISTRLQLRHSFIKCKHNITLLHAPSKLTLHPLHNTALNTHISVQSTERIWTCYASDTSAPVVHYDSVNIQRRPVAVTASTSPRCSGFNFPLSTCSHLQLLQT